MSTHSHVPRLLPIVFRLYTVSHAFFFAAHSSLLHTRLCGLASETVHHAHAALERVEPEVGMVLVVGMAEVGGGFPTQTYVGAEGVFHHRCENGEGGVATVALGIEVEGIDGAEVLTFIAFPREDFVVLEA